MKSVARNHQFLGVNAAMEALARTRSTGEKRLGVFWHTQGSGKTLSMLWFSQKVLRRMPGAWTFVMVTDRRELDEQLHGEFVDSGAVPKGAAVHANDIANLRELLQADHRYVSRSSRSSSARRPNARPTALCRCCQTAPT